MIPEGAGSSPEWLWRRLGEMRVYKSAEDGAPPFLLAPEPPALPAPLMAQLDEVGRDLDAFQEGLGELYRLAEREAEYAFVAEYLDRGKPEAVTAYGRMRRMRRHLPSVVRPDVFVTAEGLKISEVDSVPGGFGILAALQSAYADLGFPTLGGEGGVVEAFGAAMAALAGKERPTVAIAVSTESEDYRPEMEALSRLAGEAGFDVTALHPRDIGFDDDGLLLPDRRRIDVLYRFFELFDLKNVPKAEVILYQAKKRKVALTPPVKAHLEEKMASAFLFHERLQPFWRGQVGAPVLRRLKALFPETWVVDGRRGGPQTAVQGLRIGGRSVGGFDDLKGITQAERQGWVLKPSGFSEIAWGSRGVRLGLDLPGAAWDAAVEEALRAWERGEAPWILQRYHKPLAVGARVIRPGGVEPMEARGRYNPYYFRTADGIRTGGVLVTLCPSDKKFIHGMADGIMAPAAAVPVLTGAGRSAGR